MPVPDRLYGSPLFAGIAENELESLLTCLKGVTRRYRKDEFIFMAGDKATSVGIVVSGGVRVVQDDFWGHRTILAHIAPGEVFGEAFSCAETAMLPISVVASEASEVMLIDYRRIVTTCPTACGFHSRLIVNMLRILAGNNVLLTRKMEHLSKRTTREKLLSFLSARAALVKSTTLEIPFNRQELADYLCVERSAMSRELSAMQAEGLILYTKNRFELIRTEAR